VGEGSERIAAGGDSKNNLRSSCEAHNVSSSSKEDRGVSTGEMGKVEILAEEGCLIGWLWWLASPRSGGEAPHR
jgi:hypothetical protein